MNFVKAFYGLSILYSLHVYAMEEKEEAKNFMNTFQHLKYKEKDHKKVQLHLEQGVQNKNNYIKTMALGLLGESSKEKEDYEAALAFFEQVIKLSDNDNVKAQILVKIAYLYGEGGHGILQDYAKALDYIKQAETYSNVDEKTRVIIQNKKKALQDPREREYKESGERIRQKDKDFLAQRNKDK